MKFLRILALMLAALMCLSVGFAEEEADDNTELFNVGSGIESEVEDAAESIEDGDEDNSLYDTAILGKLDVDVDEWLLSDELRAMLAVIMEFELYCNEDFDTETLSDTCGDPVIYVAVPADLDGLAVSVMFYYTDADLVISASYLPILGQYTAFQSELSLDPDIAMYALNSEGLFSEYYEVSNDDYYDALYSLSDAITGD